MSQSTSLVSQGAADDLRQCRIYNQFDVLVTKAQFAMHAEVLATNNRLKHLYRISDLYDELVAAAKGEVHAKITTAQGLEPEELEDIKDGLSKYCQLAVHHAEHVYRTCNNHTEHT